MCECVFVLSARHFFRYVLYAVICATVCPHDKLMCTGEREHGVDVSVLN